IQMRLDRHQLEAVMKRRLSRRALLGVGPTVLASCVRRDPYFGKPTPPPTQTLVYEIGGEPSSLDPATCLGNTELYVMHALFEGLVSPQLHTMELRAGLATHYEVAPTLTEFRFFLRGHPSPAGTMLPGAGSAPPLWSYDHPVTADDFVYAWRRLVDPANGGVYASSLYPI